MSIENDLIARYGRGILTVERKNVPPRVAKKKNLLAVIPRRNARKKLETEIKREGYKAHVARHRVTKEVTANFVFTNALPAFAKHAREVMAELPAQAIRSLYGARPPRPSPDKPYKPGDVIRIRAGIFEGAQAKLAQKKSKSTWYIDVAGGARISLHVSNMIRIDPG